MFRGAECGYDTLNRLTSGPLGSYSYGDSAHLHASTSIGTAWTAKYDALGDMTCRAPTSVTTCNGTQTGAQLGYDNEGRLSRWQDRPGSPTTTDAFLYDGAGQRVEQQVTAGGSITTTTTYVGGGVEEITTTRAGSTLTKYFAAAGLPTAMRVGTSGPLSYLASDGLGSVSESLDGGGTVTSQQLYDPYGKVRYSSGASPTSHGYTGQQADATTGLDYYNARYYDPLAGQFASADSEADGLNRYGYVQGNPETYSDPTGHRRCFDDGCVLYQGDSGAGAAGGGSHSSGGCHSDSSCGCYSNCGGGHHGPYHGGHRAGERTGGHHGGKKPCPGSCSPQKANPNPCPSGLTCRSSQVAGRFLIFDSKGRCWDYFTCDQVRGSRYTALTTQADQDNGHGLLAVIAGKVVAAIGYAVAGLIPLVKADLVQALGALVGDKALPIIKAAFGADSPLAKFTEGLQFALQAALAALNILTFVVFAAQVMSATLSPLKIFISVALALIGEVGATVGNILILQAQGEYAEAAKYGGDTSTWCTSGAGKGTYSDGFVNR